MSLSKDETVRRAAERYAKALERCAMWIQATHKRKPKRVSKRYVLESGHTQR